MGPIYLFDVASRANQWLVARQSAIAENIANANTPGFKAQDVKPFAAMMDTMSLDMTATRPGHLPLEPTGSPRTDLDADDASRAVHSGNTVSMEKEMIKAGEVNRSFALNTSILKSFQRMLLASSKG